MTSRIIGALLWIFIAAAITLAQTDFSQENAITILRHLSVDIGPRPMGSPAERAALEYAVDKLQEYGCDTAYIMPMYTTERANTNSGTAVGIRRGTSGRMIVIGGHIDSASPEIPGADDDASGIAVVLDVARVFSQRQTQSTLVFACFGGEEQGLKGSTRFVNDFPEIDSVVLMLQIDMANGLGVIDIDPDSYLKIAPAWLVRAAVEEYSRLGYDHLRYPTHFFSLNYAFPTGSGSDHQPFLDRGIPAVDFSTDVAKPIHTPRDIFENFDPLGLKRSGDLVIRLIERFDGGVPSRETDHYWLYLLGTLPIILPIWALYVFSAIAIALSILTLIRLRRRQQPIEPGARVKWSGLKIWIFTIIAVACAWLSSDLIAVIRGVRHPWLTSINWYYLLAAFAAAIGGWFALRLGVILKLSTRADVLFLRAVIILTLYIVLLGLLSAKLTVEPAVGLLLISLALLVRNPVAKVILLALSPWWFLRLVFSEWDSLLFRSIAPSIPATPWNWILFNGSMILGLSLYVLPFVFAGAAVVRDSQGMTATIKKLRSPAVLIIASILFVALGFYLLTVPVFNEEWYRNVRVEQKVDLDANEKEVTLTSSSYLHGLRISHEGGDTVLHGRITRAEIVPTGDVNTSWASVVRDEQTTRVGDTAHVDLNLLFSTQLRPYTITISYSSGGGQLKAFDTPLKFHSRDSRTLIEWYSFPDTLLHVPVSFSFIGSDSVEETVEIVFADLAYPMELNGEKTSFIPRTKFVSRKVYR